MNAGGAAWFSAFSEAGCGGLWGGLQIYHSVNFLLDTCLLQKQQHRYLTCSMSVLHGKTDIIHWGSKWTFVYFHIQLKWLNYLRWFSRGVWKVVFQEDGGWERFTQRLQTCWGKPSLSRCCRFAVVQSKVPEELSLFLYLIDFVSLITLFFMLLDIFIHSKKFVFLPKCWVGPFGYIFGVIFKVSG